MLAPVRKRFPWFAGLRKIFWLYERSGNPFPDFHELRKSLRRIVSFEFGNAGELGFFVLESVRTFRKVDVLEIANVVYAVPEIVGLEAVRSLEFLRVDEFRDNRFDAELFDYFATERGKPVFSGLDRSARKAVEPGFGEFAEENFSILHDNAPDFGGYEELGFVENGEGHFQKS